MDKPDILSIIKNRRSVRSFHPDEIPPEHEKKFMEVLRWAPSAGNRQPWHFFLIKKADARRKLAEAAYQQNFVAQAPLVVVVCADPEASAIRYGDRGRNLYVYQDTAAAVQNLLLLATSLGYGSCWVGAFQEEAVKNVLGIRSGLRPVAMIPIGKPAKIPHARERREINEIITILE